MTCNDLCRRDQSAGTRFAWLDCSLCPALVRFLDGEPGAGATRAAGPVRPLRPRAQGSRLRHRQRCDRRRRAARAAAVRRAVRPDAHAVRTAAGLDRRPARSCSPPGWSPPGCSTRGSASGWRGSSRRIGIDMATAGATAVIADQVPDEQRGAISAAIYGPQAVGILVGVGLLTAIGTKGVLGYALLAVLLLACTAPFVRCYRDAAAARVAAADGALGRRRPVGAQRRLRRGRSAGARSSTSATRSARPTCSTSCRTT